MTFINGRAREGLWVAGGNAIAVAGTLIGVRLLTERLRPAVFGTVALGLTIVTLTQQLVVGPLCNGLMRYFTVASQRQQFESYFAAGRRLVLMAAMGIGGAGLLASTSAQVLGASRWASLIISATFLAVISTGVQALDSIQNAARQRTIVAWHDGIGAWLRYGVAILLITIFSPSAPIALTGYAVAAMIEGVSQYGFFSSRVRPLSANEHTVTREEMGASIMAIYRFSAPFAIWGGFTWARLSCDRWLLDAFADTQSVGLYAVLYQIGYFPILILTTATVQFLAPILFSRAGDASNSGNVLASVATNRRLVHVAIAASLIGAALASILHRPVFELLVGPEYRSVSRYLPWMILSGGLFAAGQLAGLVPMVRLNSRELLFPTTATAVLGIVATAIGARFFGIPGVVAASVVFSLAYLGAMMRLSTMNTSTRARRSEA